MSRRVEVESGWWATMRSFAVVEVEVEAMIGDSSRVPLYNTIGSFRHVDAWYSCRSKRLALRSDHSGSSLTRCPSPANLMFLLNLSTGAQVLADEVLHGHLCHCNVFSFHTKLTQVVSAVGKAASICRGEESAEGTESGT